MVTDYAEGELFQILEDDGSLPEDQVTILAVAMQCLLQDGGNGICLSVGSGSLLWARRHQEGEDASGALPGRAFDGEGPSCIGGQWGPTGTAASLFCLQGAQH